MLSVCLLSLLNQDIMFESELDMFDSSLDEEEVRAASENVDTLDSLERLGINDRILPNKKCSAGKNISAKNVSASEKVMAIMENGAQMVPAIKKEGVLDNSILCCKTDICADMCSTCKEIVTEREKAMHSSKVKLLIFLLAFILCSRFGRLFSSLTTGKWLQQFPVLRVSLF